MTWFDFIPNWIFHLILIAGVLGVGASYVLSFIPFVRTYLMSIRVIGIALIVVGVFCEGMVLNDNNWKLKVAEAEKRALEAEAKASKENVRIVTKLVDKIHVVNEVQVVTQQEIVEKAVIIDNGCKVAPEAIAIHNKAATRPGDAK